MRWSLPENAEFVWLPPNYQYQRNEARGGVPAVTERGFGPTTLGVKQEICVGAELGVLF